MAREIRHEFFVAVAEDAIVQALLDPGQIRSWWSREARLDDGCLVVSWSGHGWEVALEPSWDARDHTVTWHCLRSNMQGTNAWEGTNISFKLGPVPGGTRIEFAQTGYRDSPCYETCVGGWAFFVGTSLKQFLETGKGIPYPDMQDTSTIGDT
jgi:hypothetical protein